MFLGQIDTYLFEPWLPVERWLYLPISQSWPTGPLQQWSFLGHHRLFQGTPDPPPPGWPPRWWAHMTPPLPG
jgi:hypothetical protein